MEATRTFPGRLVLLLLAAILIACQALPAADSTPTTAAPLQTSKPAALPLISPVVLTFSSDDKPEQIVSTLKTHLPEVLRVIQNPDPEQELRIRVLQPEGEPEELTLIADKDRRSLRIIRKSTEETKMLKWDSQLGIPTIKLTNAQGKTEHEERLLSGFPGFKLSQEDLIKIGTVAVAAALSLWLLKALGSAILGAIAFLAFAMLVVGLGFLVIGFLDNLGLNKEKLMAWYEHAIQEGTELLDILNKTIPAGE